MLDWVKKLLGVKPKEETKPSPDQPAAGASNFNVPALPQFPNLPGMFTSVSGNPSRSVQPTAKDSSSSDKPKTLNLDAGSFLPISRSEMVTNASASTRMTWWQEWNARDRIPTTDDLRTRTIDRGMVSQGLVTPEELVEMHKLGAEMDRLRPTYQVIQQQSHKAGQEAVEESKKAKAELKQRKKEEAAERKRMRAEQIAQNKATDVLFLGRGVSRHLSQRESDIAKLEASNLPLLSTPADIATALGLTIPQLRGLAFHSEVLTRTNYIQFNIPKKCGGTRVLSAPHRRLKAAQYWILENILEKLPTEEAAHGFVPKRSCVTNALPHVRKAAVLNMDLKDFFPGITFPRVRSLFHRLGYSPAAATILALLCTECPRKEVVFNDKKYHVATGPRGLPQGACTSPALANQVARRLDKRLAGLAKKWNFQYTRYADDLTFSGDEAFQEKLGYLTSRVRHLAKDCGFEVNETKTRVFRKNYAQIVTGLVVNEKPSISRAERKRIRAILHRAKKEGLAKQNRDNHPSFEAWLCGMIAYVNAVQPELGAKWMREFRSLRKSE